MIGFLRRHRKPFFVATISIFLMGTFVGLGGYLFTSRDYTSAIAKVGSVKISYTRYLIRLNQYLDSLRSQGAELTDENVAQIKQAMVRDMIVDQILLMKAEEWGVDVSDQELARDIRSTPAFQRNGVFDEGAYLSAVRSIFRDTPRTYEKRRRNIMKTTKFKQIIYHTAKLTPAEIREAYRAQNDGSLKDFDKNKDAFHNDLQQQRALALINYYLRQVSTQIDVRSFLAQREQGL